MPQPHTRSERVRWNVFWQYKIIIFKKNPLKTLLWASERHFLKQFFIIFWKLQTVWGELGCLPVRAKPNEPICILLCICKAKISPPIIDKNVLRKDKNVLSIYKNVLSIDKNVRSEVWKISVILFTKKWNQCIIYVINKGKIWQKWNTNTFQNKS